MSYSDSGVKTRKIIERKIRLVHGSNDDYALMAVKPVAAATMKQKCDQEKEQLIRLNERFAVYIERVKFLEGQNKKLTFDLEELRHRWGDESRLIREHYEPELLLAREEIDNTTKGKVKSDIKAKRGESEAINYKKHYESLLDLMNSDKQKIQHLEFLLQENSAELELLSRQTKSVEADIFKYRTENQRLSNDIHQLLDELDNETLKCARLENEKQTLEEQIPFLNSVHEHEVAELRALQVSQIDPVQFYRHELERAIRDIRDDFAYLNETQRRELEEWYKVKTEEFEQEARKRDQQDQTMELVHLQSVQPLRQSFSESQMSHGELKRENAELLNRLNNLEEELDAVRRRNGLSLDERDAKINEIKLKLQELLHDYEQLMSNKNTLEFEINTYKRLLESEEQYTSKFQYKPQEVPIFTYKQAPKGGNKVLTKRIETNQTQTSEMTAKTTFQRSAKGPVSISECSPDGRVIVIENTSRNKDVLLKNWVLKRRVDNKPEITYKFPDNVVLEANRVLRIWANGQGKESLPSDLVNRDIDNWEMGINIVTIMLNDIGDEKATHLQKTVYTN